MSLETFVPQPRAVAAGGRSVAVLPLRVRQIPPFARAIAPAMSAIAAGNITAAIAEHGEALVQAISVATGEPEDWLGELAADEFLAICIAVVEVNADFFGQKVAPMLEQALSSLATAMSPSAGPTPSPSSPQPGLASSNA